MSIKSKARAAARYCKHNCWWLVVGVSFVAISSAAAYAYGKLGPTATFEQTAQLLEVTLLAFGLVSIVLLIAQLRQTAAWNGVLSYHEYFSELPDNERAENLYLVLERLKIAVPSTAAPLSAEQAQLIWQDEGGEAGDGTSRRLVGRRVIREYLNDFEEFCGAVGAGVVNESYVRELEGHRVITAYYGFEEIIKLFRSEAGQNAPARTLQVFRQRPYLELRRIASGWRRRRELEYQKFAKKRTVFQQVIAEDEEWDGVDRRT